MDDAKRKAIIETLKSIGRGLWFGILGLIVVALTALASSGEISSVTITVAGLTVNLSVVIVAVVGFLAKTIDTYIHKNENIDINGIAPGFLQK
jgi:drug/metabolite transporter (DMT)-like permease